jgi:predicted amidohydrolase
MSLATDNLRSIRVAAVQMDANPAPTVDRLKRAGRLVNAAVETGAKLVVLPEVFNTGYNFMDENHTRVEKMDGLTGTWMRDTAARHNIHLAGSLMLLDRADTYNTMLLFAPDGRFWRYDKNYPWGWEQGYFRKSRRDPKITIADTDLGNIGMLICWDVSHRDLWELYAGRVDLMVISSCPVDAGHATYQLPAGDQFTLDEMGSSFASSVDAVQMAFGKMIDQQAAWLGVPVIHAIESGHVFTDIPMGRRALMGFGLVAPWLFKYLPEANGLKMSCDLVHECKILGKDGEVLGRLTREEAESYISVDINLANPTPSPQAPQPDSPVPRATYFLADRFLPTTVKSVYRKGQQLWRDL